MNYFYYSMYNKITFKTYHYILDIKLKKFYLIQMRILMHLLLIIIILC